MMIEMIMEKELNLKMLPVLESHAALFPSKPPSSPLFRPKIGKIAVETLPRKSVKNSAPQDFIRQNRKPVFVQMSGPAKAAKA